MVTGVVYNGRHPVPRFHGARALPANKALSGIQSREFGGRQFNELLFDDTNGQVRAKLSSEHGSTQLNQGYLTTPRSNGKADPRGEGFEMRTDKAGALRAATGLLLSTEAQPGASGQQLDRVAVQQNLNMALSLSQSLAQAATGQAADTMETGPQQIQPDNSPAGKAGSGHLQHLSAALQAWPNGSNAAPNGKGDQPGQQPLLVLSGLGGLVSASGQSQAITAATNLDLVAQRDTNQTTARRWLHNVGQNISLYVRGIKDKISLKLLAEQGKIQVQAQHGEIEITGDQNIQITSCKGKIQIAAEDELVVTCGGAYVRLKGGNIDVHCPGTLSMKAAQHQLSGPGSMNVAFPQFPNSVCKSCAAKAAAEANPLVAGK
jgi:type VI secretion system secreted protein VgrG